MTLGNWAAIGGLFITICTIGIGAFEWRLRQTQSLSEAHCRDIARQEDEKIWLQHREDHQQIRADIAVLKADLRDMILRMRDQLRAELGK